MTSPESPGGRPGSDLGEAVAIPPIVVANAFGAPIEPIWRNELGGLTFRAGDRVVKWQPAGCPIDLAREAEALAWLVGRHPAPVPLGVATSAPGEQYLVTRALPGESAVAPRWRARPAGAVRAIALGLRRLHAVPVAGFDLTGDPWHARRPPALGAAPAVDDPVLVHGDACAPNTLLDADGGFAAHVDLGALGVGDRWADLAVASMSLGWNYGPGWEGAFFAAYGVARDERRIRYYRALWEAQS